MVTLKIGDRIRCKHFVYVRDTSAGFIFDYASYWFNEMVAGTKMLFLEKRWKVE